MRRGFTLIEVLVAGLVGLVLLGALTFAFVGARQTQALSGRHLELLEGATLAMHQLRTDLRQLSFVPGRPVEGYSLRIGADKRSVRLRRSAPSRIAGSSFVIVDYRLEPAPGGRYHLVRAEWAASAGRVRDEKRLRGASLRAMSVRFREDEPNNARVLHVTFDVTSTEGGAAAPELVVSSVLQIQRPEQAFGSTLPLFAEPIPGQIAHLAETPPGEVLAPSATDAGTLPPL